MRRIASVSLAATLLVFSSAPAGARMRPDRYGAFEKQIPKDRRIDHALNRLTFGPRPGDAARVASLGLKKWIDLQLRPGRIPDNPLLLAKLEPLDSLRLSSAEVAARSRPAPARNIDVAGALSPDQIRALRTAPLPQRLALFQSLPPQAQNDVIAGMPAVRQALFDIAPPDLRRRIVLSSRPQQIVERDLLESKLLRAVYSERQLEEALVDFWFNRFNVYLGKGADRFLTAQYEREAIRPHILGKFRDLLEATAKSPAMLFYLDNWQSVGPDSPAAGNRRGNRRGLNENYGRELLELHTLGVDGGYTQKDVTETARCFTGWTIRQPQQGGEFFFNPRMHDAGEKTVLGIRIPAGGGIRDGERVLDILARHPSTARFISRQLAQRFVADDPPPSLVDRMAQTFLKTDGDLREVLKTMLNSKEFWSEGAYRSKLKSPLEFVASSVRALDADVDYAFNLANQVGQLGEPLYRKQEPTGYSNSSAQWANSAGLLARMNFAVQLAENRIPGVKVAAADGIAIGAPEFQKR